MKKIEQIWLKILPIEIGTRVKIIASEDRFTSGKDTFIGMIGEVIGRVEDDWKISMVEQKCYPECILKEEMYEVKINGKTSWAIHFYAFRYTEIIPLEDGKVKVKRIIENLEV